MLRALLQRWKPRKPDRPLFGPAQVHARHAKIAVTGMAHRYANEVVALQDVDLNIRSGDFVCLLGPSGCGKSTLLYALAGHLQPTGGHVAIDGRPITGPGPERLLMFQDAALFPWLSVEGNVTFALAAQGWRGRSAGRGRASCSGSCSSPASRRPCRTSCRAG